MPTIHFIDRHGTERQVAAETDTSLMQVALNHGIPGIASECGGCCLCHTCHAFIDHRWMAWLPEPSDAELGVLDHMPQARSNSRLTCKVFLTEDLDGLVVRTT